MEVTLLMAMTVDGKIAKNPDHFPDWTGPDDKKFFAERTRQAGVVIMGARTFQTLKKPLPDRLNVVMTRDDSRTSSWNNVVFTTDPPRRILTWLESLGYREVILAGGAIINSLFAAEGLIDRLIVTVSPKVFGSGISLFNGQVSMALALEGVKIIGQDVVVLSYRVVGHPKI
ncbi:dihydrofolate reductase family protein [Desulfosoma caldarium]|uniref:Dihydrofolate reductase n=1 Tax=Desulfosoma caldarium TaxID=610254 RepID=A0A3N1UUM1_9BACT|nr:dihydrofolate reductase family protein [Desulfosoma caldarium]ROQ93378.1 dihydrofolate reductase [Desulfosoma caldarium]